MAMPFAILGCPRSGTNLLSSLVKHLQEHYFLVEPFSMNLNWVLQDDLCWSHTNFMRLHCACHSCFVCDLRSEIVLGRINFKETSLFEYLDVIAHVFKVRRIVYIERNLVDIINSYMTRKLYLRWQLNRRTYFQDLFSNLSNDNISLPLQNTEEFISYYVTSLTLKKQSLWVQHRHHFEFISVHFDRLVREPLKVVQDVADFLHLSLPSYMPDLIHQKIGVKGNLTYPYGTFRRS